MKHSLLTFSFFGFCLLFSSLAQAQTPFIVVKEGDPTITTHEISSGGVVLGITNTGGGMINKFSLPGYGDLMGPDSDKYGRGGQTAIRSFAHGGKYNPTQAGHTDDAGTQCNITQTTGKLVIDKRPCSLWNGDQRYDYIEWEDLVSDGYRKDGGSSGQNSDVDGIDETSLPGRQAEEVTSEFDFYGVYEDYMGTNGVDIPCFYSYYEFEFIRYPGHCLNQFNSSTSIFDPTHLQADLTVSAPTGVYPGTDVDMNNLTHWSTLRLDKNRYPAEHRFYIGLDGQLISELRGTEQERKNIHLSNAEVFPLLIISESADINDGSAIGVFQPNSTIVSQQTVGGTYTDDRRFAAYMDDEPERADNMQKFGFGGRTYGLLNRNRTPNNDPETWRGEMYYLVGTPAEIYANALKINAAFTSNGIASSPASPTLNPSSSGCEAVVNISWVANASSDSVTMYEVWRSTSPGGTYTFIGSSIGTTFTDNSDELEFGTQYFYKIRALNLGGSSNFSPTSSVTTTSTPGSCNEFQIVKGWDFSDNDEGWNRNPKNLSVSWASAGYLDCTTNGGNDPWVYNTSPQTFQTTNANYLYLRVKNETSSTTGQVIVFTASSGNKPIFYSMTPNNSTYEEIVVDLSTVSGWNNSLSVTDVRLDPNTNGATGSISYDFVYFTNSVPLVSPNVVKGWDFENNLEGWNGNKNNVTAAWNNAGYLDLTTNGGNDPWVRNSSSQSFAATDVNYLEVRLRNGTASSTGTIVLFHSGGTIPIVVSSTPNSSSFETIIVDLLTVNNYSNSLSITDVRLDPNSDGAVGTFSYDYVHFLNDIPNEAGSGARIATVLEEETILSEESAFSGPNLYPNPVASGDMIHLSLSDEFYNNPVKATVLDLSGRELLVQQVDRDHTQISTAGLKQGIHLLRLESEGIKKVLRFHIK